jgi:hypothetical protein
MRAPESAPSTVPPRWAWVPCDSEWPEPHMGRVVPRMPRNRNPVLTRPARPAPVQPRAKLTRAPAAAGPLRRNKQPIGDTLRGALVGAAIALLGMLAVHAWSLT